MTSNNLSQRNFWSLVYIPEFLEDLFRLLSIKMSIIKVSSKRKIKGSERNISAMIESGGRRTANKNDPRNTHERCFTNCLWFITPKRSSTKRTIGNWNPTPINAEVRKTVERSPLISKMLPIPKDRERAKNISICHFMTIAPKKNPAAKRKTENGRSLDSRWYSFLSKAGFRKWNTW